MDYDGGSACPSPSSTSTNDQFQLIGQSIELAEPMSKYAVKEDYMSANGKVVGGTGKFFVPVANGSTRCLPASRHQADRDEACDDGHRTEAGNCP